MDITYLGERIFLDEIRASGWLWLARGPYNNIYSLDLDEEGFSLPVWSSSARVESFLKNARLVGTPYTPHGIPVEVFTTTWLSDRMKGIAELQINPDGRSSRVLVYTVAEFLTTQAPA